MSVTQTNKKEKRANCFYSKGKKNDKGRRKKPHVHIRLINFIYQIGEVSSLSKICLLPLHTVLSDPKTNLLSLSALITSIISFFKDE